MIDFHEIYARQADAYQSMIAFEDYNGNLLPALQAVTPLVDQTVVEFGAGTGRLSVLLAPLVRHIYAFDRSAHMLALAVQQLRAAGAANWLTGVADNTQLPVAAGRADIAIEGWSFGHLTGWYPTEWPARVAAALAEMQRVLAPGGTAILLETLGTGYESPTPPTPALAAFYRMLEDDYGFAHTWLRTDYQFETAAQGAAATRFFFGDTLADWLLAEDRTILPECSGLWWRQM